MSAIANLRHQTDITRIVVRLNSDGISHDDSLVRPHPGGNCFNWVLGHLVAIYGEAMPLLGQQPVQPREELSHYQRGAAPITNAAEAIRIEDLQRWWAESCARFDAGLATLTEDRLAERAPFSPSNDPNETVGSLLATLVHHQAYHSGQLGVLRRVAGKPGAIK
ncbi:MAG: DinB family protein [Gemmatimonadota bacterium]|nr:DinB family protein [Gemmatimonadota bacterium]